MNLESKRPSGPLFRVGRDDDAWAVPDWAYAKEDGTFGNRFDDPMGVYRVAGSFGIGMRPRSWLPPACDSWVRPH